MKHVVYCTISFLENLYLFIERRKLSDWLEDDENDTVKQLYKFIHSANVDIYTDENLAVKSKTNPNFKKLIKSGKHTELRKQEFELLFTNKETFFKNRISPGAVFLIDNIADSKLIDEYGYLAFSKDEIKECSFLFCHSIESFVKGAANQWEFISKYAHPFNALVIADAHLLSTKESKDNLTCLLNNFLPKNLRTSLDLTIISDRDEKGKPSDIVLIRNELLENLKHLPYAINLTIVLSKIHDRNLITNYLWCSSGYGFELIKNGKNVRNTHITFVPVTYNGKEFQGYKLEKADKAQFFRPLEIIEALKKEYNNAVKGTAETMGLYKNVVGNRQNRILN